MPRGEERHPEGRRRPTRWWWLAEGLTVLLVALAFVAVETDAGVRLGLSPDPDREPEQVAPPLSLPTMRAAGAVARPLTTGDAGTKKVLAALAPGLADPRLGPRKRVLVTDLRTGKVVLDQGTGTVTPASTMKLLTSTAALQALGPAKRFATTVVRGAGRRVILIGGGDPFLMSAPPQKGTYPARADLTGLAAQAAAALRKEGTTSVTLGYDDSLFGEPAFNPRWPATYRVDVAPPITALLVDEGHNPGGAGYSTDPSRVGAEAFATALRAEGITVEGGPIHQTAPKGTRIARVVSATLGQIVARLLLVSDNNAAEVVAHHVGVAEGTGGTFAGGAAGVTKVLTRLGVPTTGAQIHDGSGLSRDDRVDPATIMGVLRAAASGRYPRLGDVLGGLPVAGFSGSLADRFDEAFPSARGRVRAKTGTLRGVHGLAGVATDADGDVLGFVLVVDQVAEADDTYAEDQLDKVAGALGACSCRAVGAAS